MSATALQLVRPRDEEEAAAGPARLFAPDMPLTWWYGRLRYADERKAPANVRLVERVRRVWYDRLKSPRVSPEDRCVFPDFQGNYGSRAEARGYCRDRNCFVMAFPHGQPPLGDELFINPTFCRPLLERQKDAEHAAAYTADLDELERGIVVRLIERIDRLEARITALSET